MPARKRSQATPEETRERLHARIAELEQRIVLLEARMRRVTAETEGGGRKAAARPARPRPRCAGCRLELPKGPRGESCVWCGFIFEALGRRRAMK